MRPHVYRPIESVKAQHRFHGLEICITMNKTCRML